MEQNLKANLERDQTTAEYKSEAGTYENDGHGRETDASAARPGLRPLQVISSVLAAGLGVQSSRNRTRDFEEGRAGTFIVAGIVFTALFIGTVYTVVSIVLSSR